MKKHLYVIQQLIPARGVLKLISLKMDNVKHVMEIGPVFAIVMDFLLGRPVPVVEKERVCMLHSKDI